MIRYNSKYELKLLLRSKWLQVLTLILLLVFVFAGYNGKVEMESRTKDIKAAKLEMVANDQVMLHLLDSLEKGMQVSVSSWMSPDQPTAVGNSYPRVADMPADPLAFTAVGQSDIYTHYVEPTFSGDDFALNFTELSNPVQLLFGSFDIAFVIIYLLPLIIIAFTYNVLSYEKEHGSLKLLASRPISLYQWALQKVILRFVFFVIIVFLVLTVSLFINTINLNGAWNKLPGFLGLVVCYILFWFLLGFIANLFGSSSAKNALSLLGLWVVIVLLLPATLNQWANTLYPVPSRTKMISDMRDIKAEASKRQDEILDNYLRDHPEYAAGDIKGQDNFWYSYMATQKLINDELAPMLSSYDQTLAKQQKILSTFEVLSPAIIMQQGLNAIAGTSTSDYHKYRQQVNAFAKTWRNYFLPLLYKNQKFSSGLYKDLPKYTYRPPQRPSLLNPILILLLFSMGLGLLGWVISKQQIKKGLLILG